MRAPAPAAAKATPQSGSLNRWHSSAAIEQMSSKKSPLVQPEGFNEKQPNQYFLQ